MEEYSRHCYHMITTQPRCLYTHSYNGEVFYVGQGRLGRPFDDLARNARWRHYVREIGAYTINIVQYFDNPTDARLAEKRLLEELQPFCNLDYRGTNLLHDDVPIRGGSQTRFPSSVDRQVVYMAQRITALEEECQRLAAALECAQSAACRRASSLSFWERMGRRIFSKIRHRPFLPWQ